MSLTREATGAVTVMCDGKRWPGPEGCGSQERLSGAQASGDRLTLVAAKTELRELGWTEHPGDRAGDDAKWFCSACRPGQVMQVAMPLLERDVVIKAIEAHSPWAYFLGAERRNCILDSAVVYLREDAELRIELEKTEHERDKAEHELEKTEHDRDGIEKDRDRLRAMLLWLSQLARTRGSIAIVAGESGPEEEEEEQVGVVWAPPVSLTNAPFLDHCSGGTLEEAIGNYIAHLPDPHLVVLDDHDDPGPCPDSCEFLDSERGCTFEGSCKHQPRRTGPGECGGSYDEVRAELDEMGAWSSEPSVSMADMNMAMERVLKKREEGNNDEAP